MLLELQLDRHWLSLSLFATRALLFATLGPTLVQAAVPDRYKLSVECIHAEQGHCYIATMDFGEPGDKFTSGKSMLMVFEDGRPLGPPHAVHASIRTTGHGRYSHWARESLYFSTSDNSDPRSNGRKYEVASRNPRSTLSGLDRFPAVQKQQTEQITSGRHQYDINMGGTLDMMNTRTLASSNCYITFQNNIDLTIENTGDVPVVNPRLVVNDRGNWYTFDSLLKEFTRGAKTDQDRVYLIWENMRQNLYHETPLFGNAEPHDPVKLFNIFGFNLCDDAGNAGCSLFHHAGFVGSKNRALRGHVQCEACVNGVLQFMDVDMDCFYLDRENERPVSGDRCAQDHDLVRRELNYGPVVSRFTSSDAPAALFGPDDRLYDAQLRGHEIAYTLRPGEKVVFRWDNVDKYCAESKKRTHRPKYFGNSKFVYQPRLTRDDVQKSARTSKDLLQTSTAGNKSALTGKSPDAFVVYAINTPYPACGGLVRATCVGHTAEDRVAIALSLDGTHWQTLWSKKGTGEHRAEVSLEQALDIHKKPAKYSYFIRIELASAGAAPGPSLHALEIETDVLAAPVSLPRLRLGSNHIRYWDETTGEHAVRITHRWKESNAVTPLPPAGMPEYPTDGASVRDSIITLRWPAVDGANRYQLRVSRRPDFLYPYRPCLDVIIPTTEWTVPYTGIFSPDTTYYWHVRCGDQWGVWGPWSQPSTFTWHGPRVPVNLKCEPHEQTITLHWKPNRHGERPVRYEVYGSDERGFSVHKGQHNVPGRGTTPGNFLGRTTNTAMVVVSPKATAAAANKAFYRVVAVDTFGTESGCSDYVELPHPFVYSQPTETATIGQPYSYTVKTLRALGDYQCKPDPSAGNQQYSYRFWDIEQDTFKLDKGPRWLSIDRKSGAMSGIPHAGDVGDQSVQVEVATQFGGCTKHAFRIKVVGMKR